ncbi:hypothetical protein LguiB_032972 [Lonicera macranthoides]
MKQVEVEIEGSSLKLKQAVPPPPPPLPPPIPTFAINPSLKRRITVSVTNEEIAKFWRQKRMVEEDHLLAAIKAAACIRARNLSEEDYKLFEESLNEENNGSTKNSSNKDEINQEVRVGIKDWWTKSKYAYLNQPVIESTSKPKRSTYIPNSCFYKPAYPPTASFGIF